MSTDARSSVGFLPGVYREQLADPDGSLLLDALLAAFDEALRPVFEVLDNQDAYLDPSVAPPHALRWLTGWLGLVSDDSQPIATQRRIIEQAGALYAGQGTVAGLRQQIAIVLGTEVQIEDESGGVSWTNVADQPLPERPPPAITVWVRPTADAVEDVFLARARTVVRALTPMGVRSRVELSS